MLKPDSADQQREVKVQQGRAFIALNSLASGVAHDFSNVIAGIISSAEVMQLEIPPDSPSHESLDFIIMASKRAGRMLHQLKDFGQRPAGNPLLVVLPPVVEEAINSVRQNLPATVEVVQQVEQNCPAILADAAQIKQIIINLCRNTSHSLAGRKGRIEVCLGNCDVDENLAIQTGLSSGPHVMLSVRDDNGHYGKHILARIFEPFACKQSDGRDSGLELFAVREMVHAHGGAITVDSAPTDGTVFRIYFPVRRDK